MAGTIELGSGLHKRHLNGLLIATVIESLAEETGEERKGLRKQLAAATSEKDRVAISRELAKIEANESDFVTGFRAAVNGDMISDKSSDAAKAGYKAGREAINPKSSEPTQQQQQSQTDKTNK